MTLLVADRQVEVLACESKQGAQSADNSGDNTDPSLDVLCLLLGGAVIFLLGVVSLGVIRLVSCVVVVRGRRQALDGVGDLGGQVGGGVLSVSNGGACESDGQSGCASNECLAGESFIF